VTRQLEPTLYRYKPFTHDELAMCCIDGRRA
jgi:hypothetical protein